MTAGPEQVGRLRRWWASAASTVTTSTWETRAWVMIGMSGVLWKGLASSIPVLFFISCYANAKATAIQKRDAQREMLEEEAAEK